MPGTYLLGQLVEITGFTPLEEYPKRWLREYPILSKAPQDLSGHRGQLINRNEDTQHWLIVTLQSVLAVVNEKHIKPLKMDDVGNFDVVLGPRSEPEILGAVLVDHLQCKGHALCHTFVSPQDLRDMYSVAQKCVSEGLFERLPSELEPGYLGRDGQGKTMYIQDKAQEWIQTSTLRKGEQSISSVANVLKPLVNKEFGFNVESRTDTLLMLPFDQDEEQFEAQACDNQMAANFLAMMHRAKVVAILNAGPSDATLDLMPKPGSSESGMTINVQPGTLALFMWDRYKFSYRPQQQALTMMSWFLDVQKAFEVSSIYGDFSKFPGSVEAAPPMPNGEHVNVVSLATRYAFGMDEPWKLWAGYCKAGIDTFTEFPLMRWDLKEYYDPNADQGSSKSYTKHGGFSDGIEFFDCRFFDISPAEAKTMDPTQRQVLEVGYIALSGAGFAKQDLQKKSEQVGVFVGIDKNEWGGMPKEHSASFGASSSANAITSNRFNYCLNLKGPSMTMDTACSASLVATHTAKLYLTNKMWDPCSACVAIGVNLLLSPVTFIACCGAGMLSHKGRCFTYDGSADGYARGESTASVALKNHPFNKDEGDLCIIAGSNVNQDGKSATLTAPNGPSQEKVASSVLREADISPAEVDTTECHGTGTALGDPIEIGAYRKVMSRVVRNEPVIVTSSKSNIGHCEGSAGVSGFIKCVLMCMHAEGTPNCHLQGLNPHLDMDGFPGVLLTECVTMRSNASYNGVLSFGFGGTNACAQCWGQNTQTSRGLPPSGKSQMLKKLRSAIPAVTITGADWEEWGHDGPPLDAKQGDLWRMEVNEDGVITYEKEEKDDSNLGEAFYLTGTFNDWEYEVLTADTSLAGLHVATVTIGRTGEEHFQIVADEDPDMTFFPATPSCRTKSAPIKGPDSVSSRNQAWCLQGAHGDKYRIEFYRSESDDVSISWIPAR